MKIAHSWLREWVDPALDSVALGHELTMLGHEVESIEVQGSGLDGVVIAEVLGVRRHPEADRLSICRVSTGGGETLEVVCGAPNVRQGMKAALAPAGIRLPNGVKLRKTKIRGVESQGMLCSAKELGLGDESDGILELPDDAGPGMPVNRYLELPDAVLELKLTPNRGDCFSILGIARDIAALTGAPLADAAMRTVPASIDAVQPVELPVPERCPVFAGRIVRGIDPTARSPVWLVERLRRSGLRAIHPVVDVTNYVMLELGQPLHGFDHAQLKGTIRPRLARPGETLKLLDGRTITLNPDSLVVSDDSGAIALAGIMGGLETAVTDDTTEVFFEAAFWPPATMAGQARVYGLHTDASQRFERGVDPSGQGRAVERATELLLEIAGGQAGPLTVTLAETHVPERRELTLRASRISKLLGVDVAREAVRTILASLEFDIAETQDGWQVRAPRHRFDIEREADLIEEVARIHGYDRIPETSGAAAMLLTSATETRVSADATAALLVARDYREVITYSFVDAGDDGAISGKASRLVLANPIASDMSVMRTSLWSGMLHACAGNLSRQQQRVRLFEIGKSFDGELTAPRETLRIAGLACGPRLPEQWANPGQEVDFFDIKSDVCALLGIAGPAERLEFAPSRHPALQPGQAAEVRRQGTILGVVGKLDPRIARRFEIKPAVYLFELDADIALAAQLPVVESISRFPAIRRDIAVLVDEKVTAAELIGVVRAAAPQLVRSVRIFDVYHGPGVEAGLKSIAIGLILQETSRTLTDEDADAVQAAAVRKLHQEFAAVLRD